MNGKELSKMIRMKKKDALRPDMDSAGQEGIDPVAAWDAKQAADVNEVLDEPDAEPASDMEMGEDESSQDVEQLKKSVARIARYIDSL